MLYAIGLLYVLAFFFVGWKRPAIPLMLIFALAPFQNDIGALTTPQNPDDPMSSGGGGGGLPHFSIAEINLMLAAILFVVRRRPFRFGPLLVPTLIYLGVCAVSALHNWRSSTMTSTIQMVLYLIVAVCVFTSLGRDERDYQLAFNGLIFVGVFLSLAVLITHSGYVMGLHKNGVGGSLACAVTVCAELWFAAATPRRRLVLSWALGILVAGLFFTLSRGGWISAAAGIALILAMRRQFQTLVKCTLVMVPLIAVCWHFLPEQSREYSTAFSTDNWNIQARFNSVEFAKEQFEENPLLGVGVGLRKEYDATNLFWLTLAETGIPGMLTFFGLQFVFMRMVWKTQLRLSRNEPLYSAVAIGGALVFGGLVHGMVDHYWSRGAISVAWAGAGMATYGYLVVQQRRALARAALRQETFFGAAQAA
ncbi:MAG: O-antigen ligase family protein [Chthoniobacteraceae bacterium]|jgi:O-antigen ligase